MSLAKDLRKERPLPTLQHAHYKTLLQSFASTTATREEHAVLQMVNYRPHSDALLSNRSQSASLLHPMMKAGEKEAATKHGVRNAPTISHPSGLNLTWKAVCDFITTYDTSADTLQRLYSHRTVLPNDNFAGL